MFRARILLPALHCTDSGAGRRGAGGWRCVGQAGALKGRGQRSEVRRSDGRFVSLKRGVSTLVSGHSRSAVMRCQWFSARHLLLANTLR